jgi:hypothetical protein
MRIPVPTAGEHDQRFGKREGTGFHAMRTPTKVGLARGTDLINNTLVT